MPISPIHHVALSVSDLERSVAFYEQVLGFRRTLDSTLSGPGIETIGALPAGGTIRSALLRKPGTLLGQVELLEVRPAPAESVPHKRAGDPGFFLISFHVTGADLQAVYERVRAHGIEPECPVQTLEFPNYGQLQAFTLRDPDGTLLELIALPGDRRLTD